MAGIVVSARRTEVFALSRGFFITIARAWTVRAGSKHRLWLSTHPAHNLSRLAHTGPLMESGACPLGSPHVELNHGEQLLPTHLHR